MVKVTILPDDTVFLGMKVFLITDDPTHVLVWRKRQQGMQMIAHQKKQCDMPALLRFVKTGAIKDLWREFRFDSYSLLLRTIQRDPNMKQRTGFDPVGNFMMQLGGETAIKHR
jgi:hypothetical protein